MPRPKSATALNLKNAETKYPDICKRFRKIRKEHQLSQAEFAVILQLSESTVKQIEYGRSAPSFETLRILKGRFNLTYDYLIDGNK